VDTRAGTVVADVGGSQTRVFSIDAARTALKRGDHGRLVARGFGLKLTPQGAKLLSDKLSGTYDPGMDIGELAVRVAGG
jgi:hypothetical protein